MRVRTWSSSASSPSELATRMRRCASAYDAVTDVIAPPCSRAAASALRSSSTLRDFSTVSGRPRRRRPDAAASRRGSARPSRTPPPPPRAAAAAARPRPSRPSGERSAVCAKPVVSPRTTRKPGTAVAARRRAPRRDRRRSERSTNGDPRRTPRRSRRRRATRGRASTAAHLFDQQLTHAHRRFRSRSWHLADRAPRAGGVSIVSG